jgi:hypothetical protein
MKTLNLNPATMKSNLPEPNFHFSAYPLKALNLPEDVSQTYLHIYSRINKSNRRNTQSKVMPMTDAYKKPGKNNLQTDHIEERESDWFASYE